MPEETLIFIHWFNMVNAKHGVHCCNEADGCKILFTLVKFELNKASLRQILICM